MPIPAAAAALIAAGGQVAGGMANIAATALTNRKNRKWARQMYELEKKDALSFWDLQNEYNSPEKQMERFQAAGLNPHLIYGRGSAGNAETIHTPDVQTPQTRTPDFDMIGNAGLTYMNAIYDAEIKQAQIDNLKADNTVKYAQAALTVANTDRSKFDLQFETDLRDISASARRAALRQMEVNTDVTLRRDEREAALNASNLQVAAENILKIREDMATSKMQRQQIRAAIDNLKSDTTLKRLDAELWEKGITRSDPLWLRVLVRYLDEKLGFFDGGFNPFRN